MRCCGRRWSLLRCVIVSCSKASCSGVVATGGSCTESEGTACAATRTDLGWRRVVDCISTARRRSPHESCATTSLTTAPPPARWVRLPAHMVAAAAVVCCPHGISCLSGRACVYRSWAGSRAGTYLLTTSTAPDGERLRAAIDKTKAKCVEPDKTKVRLPACRARGSCQPPPTAFVVVLRAGVLLLVHGGLPSLLHYWNLYPDI
eukprot:COSAG05_NODE_5152_length_1252_cov_1.425846_1_plen_204_part_00